MSELRDDYDFVYFSLGGGVQSSVIAEMMAEGELPPVDVAYFADTGDEPDYVYKQIEYLRGRLASVGVPLEVVSNGTLTEDLKKKDERFAALPVFTVSDGRAGKLRRGCTSEYKIVPIERALRRELLARGMAKETKSGAIRVNKGIKVACLLGITLDEVQRMKPNSTKWITNHWPLIDIKSDRRMSRLDCVTYLESKGFPLPRKSACRICPFHKDAHWRDVKENRPEDWKHVTEFDDFLRAETGAKFTRTAKGELFLHKSLKPLKDAELATPSDSGQTDMFDVCDEGYCFI